MEGVLYPSTSRGRLAINDPRGLDLTSGQRLEIFIGGTWVYGWVEHGDGQVDEPGSPTPEGYYFVTQDGGICGLCAGMKVRL